MLKISSELQKVLVAFIVVTFVLQVVSSYSDVFYYKRDSFIKYFYYMWLTPNLVHINWMHWFLNILNFIALIFLFEHIWSSKKIVLLFVLSSAFIMVCLYIFSTDIEFYVGMSGVLYAFAIYAAIAGLKEYRDLSFFVLLYLVLKVFAHDFINKITFVDEMLNSFIIVVDVHIYGIIFGLIFLIVEKFLIVFRLS